MNDTIVVGLIEMEQQLRILHWQTKSFARHEAYGKIYGDLGDLIDAFMESYMVSMVDLNFQMAIFN